MLKHDLGNIEYQHFFLNTFIEILNKHAPMKLKFTSHEETEKEVNNLKIKKASRCSSKNYQGKCRCYFIFPIS